MAGGDIFVKKAFFLFLLFPFCVHIGFGQTVIANPEKPLSKNPGRVIRLKEVLRIVDEEKDFYFKLPWGDGCRRGWIYFCAGWN